MSRRDLTPTWKPPCGMRRASISMSSSLFAPSESGSTRGAGSSTRVESIRDGARERSASRRGISRRHDCRLATRYRTPVASSWSVHLESSPPTSGTTTATALVRAASRVESRRRRRGWPPAGGALRRRHSSTGDRERRDDTGWQTNDRSTDLQAAEVPADDCLCRPTAPGRRGPQPPPSAQRDSLCESDSSSLVRSTRSGVDLCVAAVCHLVVGVARRLKAHSDSRPKAADTRTRTVDARATAHSPCALER